MKTKRDPETAESILQYLDRVEPMIYQAIDLKTGIEAWYRAYLSSNEFAELTPKQKGESLDTFQGLKYFLNYLEVKSMPDITVQ